MIRDAGKSRNSSALSKISDFTVAVRRGSFDALRRSLVFALAAWTFQSLTLSRWKKRNP